jgi:flagellar biosynthesis/type III secretory pathway chaperone
LDWIPTLDTVHNEMNKLFVSLQRSRRSNAAELSANLMAKEAALSAALAETTDLRARNQELQEQHQRLLQEAQHNAEMLRQLETVEGSQGGNGGGTV